MRENKLVSEKDTMKTIHEYRVRKRKPESYTGEINMKPTYNCY